MSHVYTYIDGTNCARTLTLIVTFLHFSGSGAVLNSFAVGGSRVEPSIPSHVAVSPFKLWPSTLKPHPAP